jgi:hypothetical protein
MWKDRGKARERGIVVSRLRVACTLTSSSPCCNSMYGLAIVSDDPMTQRSYSYLKAPCVLSSPLAAAAQARVVA